MADREQTLARAEEPVGGRSLSEILDLIAAEALVLGDQAVLDLVEEAAEVHSATVSLLGEAEPVAGGAER